MYLQPVIASVTPANTILLLETLFLCCQRYAIGPWKKMLQQPGCMQFEAHVMRLFQHELHIAFLQRLQRVEQETSGSFSIRQTTLEGNSADEKIFLFQCVLSNGELLPTCNLAFAISSPAGFLHRIRQCFDYPGGHIITLGHTLTDTDGRQWQAGQQVAFDRVDAVLRRQWMDEWTDE